ncbi:MAG: serine/threonine protein kinase, partial [Actinomycetota bacterium]|nr:serine/threonine protein kinase [Actinomycetota bacterium]
MQRSLDGFTVIELVGFGAIGEVWRARPDDGGADVALKWLTAATVDTERLAAARLRDFRHPHVARLLDLRRDGSCVVLVQEFVAGVSLATLLTERGRLSSAEVVTLLTPVADALGAAHAAGLVHGSLTPSAVRLTPDGRPVLTDLGICPALTGAPSGTERLEYLDPSVTQGCPLTAASDVFGVAAIGFHAVTGGPPWAGGTGADPRQLATEGARGDLLPLHIGVPGRLADVIARGLSEQPERRGSAQDFAADVRAALEPEPLHLAGPLLWPDLPTIEPAETVDQDSAGSGPAPFDIAGAVRRGSSARHAA